MLMRCRQAVGSTHRTLLTLTLAAGMTAALAGGCRREADAPPPPPPQEVTVSQVRPRDVPLTFEYVGLTEPSQTVEIRSRVQGFLFTRAFTEGGQIKDGDLLFQIDPRSFEADLEIALSRVEQAQARLDRATRDLARYQELFAQNAATQKELDDAETEEIEARASLRLSKANAAKAELDLSYTSVLSPFNGVIGKSMKDVGSVVDTGANSLLATAMQTDPIYVSFSINEREVLAWREDLRTGRVKLPEGEKIRVSLILVDGTRYAEEGVISFVDVRVDPGTGTARLRATLPNAAGTLQPGQFVRAQLLGALRVNTLAIPQRAVIQTPNGAIVFVVGEGDRVEVRPVTLGPWSGADWVVDKGLNAGERVIVDGISRVQPGNVVRPVAIGTEASSAQPSGGATPPATSPAPATQATPTQATPTQPK